MTQTQYDPAWNGDVDIKGPAKGKPEDHPDPDATGYWPRMVYLDKETEERLTLWIDNEIQDFNIERGPLLEDWKRWQTLYWAEPATTEKNFPFKRAANIVIPLAAIAVESIHARLINTLFSVQPFWSIRPRSKEWIEAAKPMENFLQAEVESNEGLKVYDFCNVSALEYIKLGTCIGKTGYKRLTKKSIRQVGGKDEDFFVDVVNGTVIDRVPLSNFIMRLAESDPQTAPLVGEKHRVNWGTLKSYAQDGRMYPEAVEYIKNRWVYARQSNEPNDPESQSQAQIDSIAHVEPLWTETFEFYELWITADINGDGEDEEIVVDYHKESRTFLSIRYNWNDDLHRPYRIANLLPIEGVWSGIGICKMVEQFQNEATAIRRQRLDNATLANMAQIVLRKGMGYGPGESIFPGKMWFVDDPQKDIKEFKLSEVYPSSFENEQSVIRDNEKRVGVNDVVLGVPQASSGGTATGDLTRLAEGNKKFDLMLRNYKKFMGHIGVDTVSNMQIFGDQQAHWLILGEDGVYVEQILKMPSMFVRKGAIIELTVTDSITNRETEKQQWLQLFQVVTGYYEKVIGIANIISQMTMDPTPIIQMAERALLASDEAVKRLFETYNVPNSARFSLVGATPNGTPGSAGPAGQIGGSGNPQLAGISQPPRLANPETPIGGVPS